MKLNLKEYQNKKIITHFKNNHLILLSINANLKSQSWSKNEQKLKKLHLNYFKIYNNVATKIIKNSTYINLVSIITSTLFFLTPICSQMHIDNKIFQNLSSIYFTLQAIKLNKKVYATHQVKKIMSLQFNKNISILYQFLKAIVKVPYKIKNFNM